jgi:hypothetical protein
MEKVDLRFPGTENARLAIFNNNGHIQYLANKLQEAIDAYDADASEENAENAKTALGMYNLCVKELNNRIDNGFTY